MICTMTFTCFMCIYEKMKLSLIMFMILEGNTYRINGLVKWQCSLLVIFNTRIINNKPFRLNVVTNIRAKPQQTPSVEKHAHPPRAVYCAI